jgi:ATP-binding cassette subfamily C protein CydCD
MLADLRAGLKDRTVVMVTHNPADLHPDDILLDLSAAPPTGGTNDPRLWHREGSLQA